MVGALTARNAQKRIATTYLFEQLQRSKVNTALFEIDSRCFAYFLYDSCVHVWLWVCQRVSSRDGIIVTVDSTTEPLAAWMEDEEEEGCTYHRSLGHLVELPYS